MKLTLFGIGLDESCTGQSHKAQVKEVQKLHDEIGRSLKLAFS